MKKDYSASMMYAAGETASTFVVQVADGGSIMRLTHGAHASELRASKQRVEWFVDEEMVYLICQWLPSYMPMVVRVLDDGAPEQSFDKPEGIFGMLRDMPPEKAAQWLMLLAARKADPDSGRVVYETVIADTGESVRIVVRPRKSVHALFVARGDAAIDADSRAPKPS